MKKGAFLLAVLFCSATRAGTMDPSVPDSRYLDYGQQHECVVPIYGECAPAAGDKKVRFSASAVVVGPRWVVTAAHVVKGTSDLKVKVRGKEHSMSKVVVNKFFDEENVGVYDIAMCMSEDDMHLDFYPGLYEGRDEEGKIASICGYGATGTFLTGSRGHDGKKRAGSNKVDRVQDHMIVCSAGGEGRTSLEFMIAHGDSGGGLFIDQKLAGINSFVMATDGSPNSDYGDECCHTRVSLFAPWIRGHMEGKEPDDEAK